MLLPATQTYSDGEVVRWDQPTPPGGAEPEHPAPALDIAAAPRSAAPSAAPSTTPSTDVASADGTARGLGGTGLGLGVVALVLALVGLRRAGRTR